VLKRHADIKDVIDLKWLPVIESIDIAITKAAHNALYNLDWPTYLCLSRVQMRNRDLRNADINFHNIDDTNSLKGTFIHESAKCFNDLPVNIKKIDSYQSFGMKCRNYYFDKATV